MIAIYSSVLYGEDFISESIKAILPYVEKVFVILMKKPWGGTSGVLYNNEWIIWPDKFDYTREKIDSIKDSCIEIIEAEKLTPWNRWGYGLNFVLKNYNAKEVMFIDPDCVFSTVEAEKTFIDWNKNSNYEWAAPSQIELWRTPAWQTCRQRQMVFIIRGDLSKINFPDPPDRPVNHPKIHILNSYVHNFGFAVSESTMRWKFLTATAFSPIVKESFPNPEWYENRWLKWHPVINNKNLEVSLRCESQIPCAISYDTNNLPISIKIRYDAGEWPVW